MDNKQIRKKNNHIYISFPRTTLSNYYCIFVALLPMIQFYRVPLTNYGIGVLLSAVFTPYVLIKGLQNKSKARNGRFLISAYFIWIIIRSISSWQTVLLISIAVVHIYFSDITIDIDYVRNIIRIAAFVASIVIIIQFLLHLLGVDISFIINVIVLDEFKFTKSFITGGITRFSGLFLEPSHFALYALIGLISSIPKDTSTNNKSSIVQMIVITSAIVMSTSGIGIIGSLFVWLYYLLFINKTMKHTPLFLRYLVVILFVAIIAELIYQIPTVRLSMQRVFGTVDSYNAISGRTLFVNLYMDKLKGTTEWIFGKGYTEFEYFLPSYASIVYQYGLFAITILLIFVINSIRTRNKFVIIACIMFVGYILTSTSTFLSYIFYLSIIRGGLTSND